MKNRPLHENLDTSFVNLPALLRYLRRRQFVGSVRVELSGYEADIHLSEKNQMKVREHDHIAGRIAEGEEALQRILIRAREPGGIINVYQAVQENELPIKKDETPIKTAPVQAKPVSSNGNGNGHPKNPPTQNVKPNGFQPQNGKTQPTNGKTELPKTNGNLPKFPFELSNRFEDKARQLNLSASDWQTLLNLTAELLKTIDDALAKANLNFTAAFQKACAENSKDYPFLNPNAHIFVYKNGKIEMRQQTGAKIFAAGINETLRLILEKLGANPKFAQVYRFTAQKIVALIRQRKPLYDKFSITPQLERILEARNDFGF